MHSPLKPSPLQLLDDKWLDEKGIQLYIKRDDLIHPQLQGNKWRKLKYNLMEARLNGGQTLVTFGGPFSNHIYATAAAAKLFGFKSVGIIRGNESEMDSPTLKFAAGQGMQLFYLDRTNYRTKDSADKMEALRAGIGDFYLVPEGGTNTFALEGVAELVKEIDIAFDAIAVACGTGGTIAGIVAGLKGEKQVLGFSSLKGDDTLTARVNELVTAYRGVTYGNFSINFDYHFGGYAKVNPELIQFIKDFNTKYGIQLEPVYTGKMLYGLFDWIGKGYFKRGTTLIAIHTGGLQGLGGYAAHFPELAGKYV